MKIKFLVMLTSFVVFLNACSKDDSESPDVLETPIAIAPKDVNDNGFKAKWY